MKILQAPDRLDDRVGGAARVGARPLADRLGLPLRLTADLGGARLGRLEDRLHAPRRRRGKRAAGVPLRRGAHQPVATTWSSWRLRSRISSRSLAAYSKRSSSAAASISSSSSTIAFSISAGSIVLAARRRRQI